MVSSVKVISSKEHGGGKEVNPYVPSKLVDYNRQFELKNRDDIDWLKLGQHVSISSLFRSRHTSSIQRKVL